MQGGSPALPVGSFDLIGVEAAPVQSSHRSAPPTQPEIVTLPGTPFIIEFTNA
jgi:hypothetical protein